MGATAGPDRRDRWPKWAQPLAWIAQPGPDGRTEDRTLIISESFAGRLTAFDIDSGGGLSGRR